MKRAQEMDVWAAGAFYEPYVGRWSQLVAQELLMAVHPGRKVLARRLMRDRRAQPDHS